MKTARFFALALALIMPLISSSIIHASADVTAPSEWQISLYGEIHSNEKILDKELALWQEYYHDENMRHLFVETPYYTAEFLNIWMRSSDDDILEKVHDDLANTAAHTSYPKAFYQKIKAECPETIFHGTDVGHQYNTTGKRFLEYLEYNGVKDSEQYLLTQEAIEQGKYFYIHSDDAYRENKMAENFIREYDKLKGERVMGIYGAAHTVLDGIVVGTDSVPCMAEQLSQRYGDVVRCEDLSWLALNTHPLKIDTLHVDGKSYDASYFGKANLSAWTDEYVYREFWRLEDAYDTFKGRPKSEAVLPYNNYPMLIEMGQVFVIDYMKTDGSVERVYFRSDGDIWQGLPSTVGFTLE